MNLSFILERSWNLSDVCTNFLQVTSITRLTHSDVNTRLPGGHLPVSVLQDGLQFSPNSAEDTNAYNSRRTIPELPAIGYPYHRGGASLNTTFLAFLPNIHHREAINRIRSMHT